VFAILRTCVQVRAHAEAMRYIRDFGELSVWGRMPEKAAA
tara:strand:- start:469 stop:588 length:120 start_codon:yes stop_codon:yes gene_type:complete